ncbi:MAG: PEGA domain-containing protein, partial [Proteobacteria bacterium]|nr:PEGA domain-containing protein [Pseudomonadota bacterium]
PNTVPQDQNPVVELSQKNGEENTFDPELSMHKAATTLLDNSDSNSRLITFYVVSGRDNVADARILYGDPLRGQWLEACTTNARGRCSFSLPASSATEDIHILARAVGFQSQTKIISLAQGDKLRIDLLRGQGLEIFALRKNYQSIRGVAGVKIKLNQKDLGETDNFGYLAHNLPPKSAASLTVQMEAPGQLPAQISHTISAYNATSIIQSFATSQAPRARILLLPLKIHDGRSEPTNPSLIMDWDQLISEGVRQNFINTKPFTEPDMERITTLLEKNGLSVLQISRNGWSQTDLQSEFEWALRPLLILGPQAALELSLLDADGQIIASSLQRLTSKPDAKNLRSLLANAAREISGKLPFEGSLVEADKQGFRINLSHQAGFQLQAGEKLKLHALQSDAMGSQKIWTDIGSAVITKITDYYAQIRVDQLNAKAMASVGQTVVLDRDHPNGPLKLSVRDQADKRPLAQANIYLQNQWLGATDRQGIARLNTLPASKRGLLQIVRPGYKIYQSDLNELNAATPEFLLSRSSIPLRIESNPSGAQVKVNGRLLGRTPLYQMIDINGPTAQVQLRLTDEYKTINQTSSLDEEGIDWSGVRAVQFEKDIRMEARQLISAKRLPEAIKFLENISERHPDFLLAQHELGDIYLNQSQDPIKAAAAYHRVTTQADIANFTDKRFIGTHINEAIALYYVGEKSKVSDPAAAIAYWRKVQSILDRCEDQLRFIPQEQYTQAFHSLSFYRGLSLHHIWGASQKTDDLQIAHAAWKKYIESSPMSAPASERFSMIKKAEVFYRQTQALIESNEQAQSTSKDPATKAM